MFLDKIISIALAVGPDTGLRTTANQAGLIFGPSNITIATRIGQTIEILLGLIGVVFFFFLVYAGIVYMMAGGESGEVKKATTTIKNSVIGLVLILGAYAVTNFVIGAVFGVTPDGAPAGSGPQSTTGRAPGFGNSLPDCPSSYVTRGGNCVAL